MICKLTNTIYKQFSGELPAATMRGLAIIQDDEVMAVCGVSFIASEYFITLGVKPGVNKRDIITGWAEFTNMLDDKKMYFALVDRDIATAPGLLKHFNFHHVDDDIYIYGGK